MNQVPLPENQAVWPNFAHAFPERLPEVVAGLWASSTEEDVGRLICCVIAAWHSEVYSPYTVLSAFEVTPRSVVRIMRELLAYGEKIRGGRIERKMYAQAYNKLLGKVAEAYPDESCALIEEVIRGAKGPRAYPYLTAVLAAVPSDQWLGTYLKCLEMLDRPGDRNLLVDLALWASRQGEIVFPW